MTRQGSPERPWEALFDPRGVVVVGASDAPAKWGHILARRALESCADRPVLLVNHRAARVLDRPAYASVGEAVADTGTPVDLAVVCVPAPALVGAVDDAVAAGVRALVVITAGLGELGPDGRRIEQDALAAAREGGALLVGPNCLGVADTSTGLQLSHALLPEGGVTVLSQSGNVVLDLAELLGRRGLGVARFVSVGNQADVGVVDLLAACRDHDATRAVAVYAEDVRDGRGFVAAARSLVESGKPVVLLAPGRTEAAVRSAASHTGALTTASHVVDAACVAAGIHRVDNPTEMADVLAALGGPRRLAGRRIAVVTDGGGHGAIAADTLAASGLETRALSAQTQLGLAPVLWASSTLTNPVDLAGAGDQDPMRYAEAVAVLAEADEVDGVLLTGYFGGYSTEASENAQREASAAEHLLASVGTTPLVVQTIYPDAPTGRRLLAGGVPVHRDVDRACAALAALLPRVSQGALDLPPPAPALGDPSYDGARALFAAAGVAFPAQRTVRSSSALEAALDDLTPPLVLKATGRLHKSEDGGVVLGLRDAAEARAAYAELVRRLDPPAVSVEEMADPTDGVELVVGCVRDPAYGPVLLVGLGGVLTEVLADVACALAPVTTDQARSLLRSLRGAAVLFGVRGRPGVDLDALADLVADVSHLAAAHPELAELELNPVLATPTGVLALDARAVR